MHMIHCTEKNTLAYFKRSKVLMERIDQSFSIYSSQFRDFFIQKHHRYQNLQNRLVQPVDEVSDQSMEHSPGLALCDSVLYSMVFLKHKIKES